MSDAGPLGNAGPTGHGGSMGRARPPGPPRLLPQPRELELGEPLAAWDPVGSEGAFGSEHTPRVAIELDRGLPAGGYLLQIDEAGVAVRVADDEGLQHAACTLGQLGHVVARATGRQGLGPWPLPAAPDARTRFCELVARLGHAKVLPARCRVRDWPDRPIRGVMLDVSRAKVPTLQTLFKLVDRLASFKVNHLQLYMEHTFAYRGHEEVWQHASPLAPEEYRELERYCAERGVELAPNQNTLGHFERWLRLERYRPLALAPEGFEWIGGIHRGPTTLDPSNPAAFELVADLLDQLVACASAPRVHVGLDEPFDLPPGRIGEWADWLERLRALPCLHGKELLVWGDVPALHPELVSRIPEGVTVCEWGYDRGHPFDERLARLVAAGVPFWVCPGTSSWLSVGGRVRNMLDNVAEAAEAGLRHGDRGLLVTDWGDLGHHQYLPVAEPGLAVAAALGWCLETNAPIGPRELATMLDQWVFDDPEAATGEALVALGEVPTLVTPQFPNLSTLVVHLALPQWPVGSGITAGLRAEELDAVRSRLDQALDALQRARPRRADGGLVVDELVATATLIRLACDDAAARLAGDGTLEAVPEPTRLGLADRLRRIVEEHRRLWLARNRPGGLAESVAWFEHLERCYRTGRTDPGWFGPLG
jgi:hexosaminidase